MKTTPFNKAMRDLFPKRRTRADRLRDFREYWRHIVQFIGATGFPDDPCETIALLKRDGVPGDLWQVFFITVGGWQSMRARQQRIEAAKKSSEKRSKLASRSRKQDTSSKPSTKRKSKRNELRQKP